MNDKENQPQSAGPADSDSNVAGENSQSRAMTPAPGTAVRAQGRPQALVPRPADVGQLLPPPSPLPQSKIWSVRRPVFIGWFAIIVLLGGFGVWAVESRLSGAVVASGQVEVEQQRQIVQHPDGGVVDEILVSEGDSVEAGQVLIRLDGTLMQTELSIVESQYYEILARRGRLEAERADAEELVFPEELLTVAKNDPKIAALVEGQEKLFIARSDTLKQSLDQLEKQTEQVSSRIDGIDAQLAALDVQRGLIGEELEDQQSLLSRGLTQSSRVLELQRAASRLDGQIGQLQADRASSETQKTELEVERLRLSAQRREEAESQLRDIGYRELELSERRRGLVEQVRRLDITAPVAGVVYDLKVTTPRSVIRPADELMHIIPQDRPLVISAKVATINVDEVIVGQPVVLRFAAFSSRTTPEIDGNLSYVSADALTDQATHAPYYRAEVVIPPEQLGKLGELELVPGMPVEVYIQTGERSPMSFLLKPLADYFNRAFRES